MRLPIEGWVKRLAFKIYAPYGWARPPNHVTLDLTRRCNLRCRMCYYYGSQEKQSPNFNELSSEEITSRIVQRLKGVAYDITGGEPFIRDDLLDVAAAIRRRGGGCFVTTNGTFITPEVAARIVRDGLMNWVSVSIHGLAKTHDSITRVPNSFRRAIKGIEHLLSARLRYGAKGPGVSIACTVNGLNMKEVEGLYKLAKSTGVDGLSLGHAAFITPEIKRIHYHVMQRLNLECVPEYDDLLTGPPEIPAEPGDVEVYVRTLSQIRNPQSGFNIGTSPKGYQNDDIRNHFLNLGWTYREKCFYPWRNLRVGPDGTVTPCVGYVVGNVRKHDIRSIWNNERFRRFRKILYTQKLFPGCLRCCKLK